MTSVKHCPVCGGDLQHKQVEKVLRGGKHAAILKAEADVCLKCGERLYSIETVELFDDIRRKLERQETAGFSPLGQTFQVV